MRNFSGVISGNGEARRPHCVHVPGASGLGSSPGWGHCVVFLGKTQLSQCLSPPMSINGYRQIVGEI